MAREELNWDDVNADEEVSEKDQKASNSLDTSYPVGIFLCNILECVPEEKEITEWAKGKKVKEYTCYVAKLKCCIQSVIEIEQEVHDANGMPVLRDGLPLLKVMPTGLDVFEVTKELYTGIVIPIEVHLPHPEEKESKKNRRLFVAKRIGIMSPTATELKTSAWSQSPGKQTILITEHNNWEDKDGNKQHNVKVGWSGFDFPGNYPDAVSAFLSSESAGTGATKPELSDDDLDGI